MIRITGNRHCTHEYLFAHILGSIEQKFQLTFSYSRMRTHCIPKEAPNNEHIQQHAEAYAHSLYKLPSWSSIYWWSFQKPVVQGEVIPITQGDFTIHIRTLIILLSSYFWILPFWLSLYTPDRGKLCCINNLINRNNVWLPTHGLQTLQLHHRDHYHALTQT